MAWQRGAGDEERYERTGVRDIGATTELAVSVGTRAGSSTSTVGALVTRWDDHPMRGWGVRPVPGALFGLTVAAELAAAALSWRLQTSFDTILSALYAVFAIVMAGAGALIASRHPRNAIGWLFCGFALFNAVALGLANAWAVRAYGEGWPGSVASSWVSASSWVVGGYGWILTFLLFPDGRLPSHRWWPVPWLGLVGMLLAGAGWSLSPDLGSALPGGQNPFAVPTLPTELLLNVGVTLFVAALVASIVSLVLRFRRSRGIEHQQLKWFVFAATLAGIALPTSFVLWYVTPAAEMLAAIALTALPIAAAIALLRYRLYDVDVLINRTVVYGTVTVLLATTYGATAVLLGLALGGGSAWVTAGATLVAAIAFRPARTKVQDLVDRRFNQARYQGMRRMADFLEELRAGRADPEHVQLLLREVLRDKELQLFVFLPESEVYVDLNGCSGPDLATDERSRVAVEAAGRPLAVVLHASPLHDPEMARSVVEAGGLAIEVARLRVELRRQLAEVKASRARIVQAGNQERRRIERDLHDGAQQRLVSIGLALRHAQHELGTSTPDAVSRTLDGAVDEVSLAIDELRELARGLPPAQLDAGLAPAFRDLARRAPLPVRVMVPADRFDRSVEGAAFFIGCEGLTNAVKHAKATRVTLSADRVNGTLVITVTDDGIGGAIPSRGSGLLGLADRVAALGGTLHIASHPGTGTTLTAELPCAS